MRKVIFVSGRYCPRCKYVEQAVLDVLPKYMKDSVEKRVAEDDPAWCGAHRVRHVPVFIFEEDGKEVHRFVGTAPKPEEICMWIDNVKDIEEPT